MSRNLRRLVGWVAVCFLFSLAWLPGSASALDTPNTLMTIDGMVLNHAGLFRSGTPADGFNTFSFGPFAATGNFTTLGRYNSFHFLTTGVGDKGISHNARIHSDTPEVWTGTAYAPLVQTDLDLDSDVFPWLDRTTGGQVFDPAEYQIEVKFKPNMNTGVPQITDNTAPLFTVGLDQMDGFVWDAEQNVYKRANDAFTYNIGSAAVPINDWYASAPKDADGFAIYTVPVSSPNFVQRGFYHAFGDGTFRTNNVLTGGGKVFNEETQVWDDVNDGVDPLSFGGGPIDPNNPNSQLKMPNGIPLISFGAPNAETGLSVEIAHISLKRINSGPIAARIDANSGLTFRFGSGFTYGTTQAPIEVEGVPAQPNVTDQISRFDENGLTNLIFDMRTPDNTNETHRFILRQGPGATAFDGTEATVNIRAKLLAGNTVPNLTIVAKDLDGNDNAADPFGADEYTYSLPLSMFNDSTFTTVSIPLADFALSAFMPTAPGGAAGSGPFGFANAGDEEMTEFNLYEFAGLIPPDTGLLKMELEYMEIRLPVTALVGDYNGDGVVGAADYTVWRDNLGGDGSTLGSNRDPANMGLVSQDDYDSWKANFGATNLGGGSLVAAGVPEPATLTLLALVLASAAVIRSKR